MDQKHQPEDSPPSPNNLTQTQLEREAVVGERRALVEQLEDWLETPMLLLGFAWLALLIVDLVRGLSPLLDALNTVIWGVFILDFAVKFTLAPQKGLYLRTHWLTAVSLLVPALRLLRFARVVRLLRAARAVRGLRLFRLFSSLNRGMRSLRAALGRRGFGYVVALTAVVTLAGAAGMYAFENASTAIDTYGEALWWTMMLMTTMGSDFWPSTAEGRLLCLVLSLYAFAVFGYVTATLATFFIGRDAENADAEIAGAESLKALRDEIAALREEIAAGRQEVRTLSGNTDSADSAENSHYNAPTREINAVHLSGQ
ncbi:MAG: ion transporter [Armatimonadota bacterium]